MGAKVQENKSSRERKFPRTIVPGNESSRQRTSQGANCPGSESFRERKFPGTNRPGSERATKWIAQGPIGRFASRERKGSVPR